MLPHPKTVIIICGPTAVGKTALAIELAQHFGTKIISADSRQCYRELNIGVAKPSPAELSAVHHYFINSHSIHNDVNAGVFEQYALHTAAEILKENHIAVMVGGTGLYIKAFAEGIDEIPAASAKIREEINISYKENGLVWLQQQVQLCDPVFWKEAEQQNPHRLLRALEVILTTGRSVTDFRKGNKRDRPFNIIKVGLELPREQLVGNIHFRVDKMIEQGLAAEAEQLLPFRNLVALQTVGYKELFSYFDRELTLEQAIINIKTNTRKYAKRQMTWFKKDTEIKWLNAGAVNVNEVAEIIKVQ